MRARHIIPSVILLLVVLMFDPGQASGADGSAAGEISASRLEAYLSVIAADFTRGRATGSEGFDIAADYAVSLFKVWGVQPGGDILDPIVQFRTGRVRSYAQTVPLVRNSAAPETSMVLTVARGGFQRETVFLRGTDFSVDATVPFDVRAELVFVGYGATDPDFNELASVNLRDKIIVRMDGLPGQTNPDGALFKKARGARQARNDRLMADGDASADADPARRFAKALQEGGAVGCITVALPTEAPAGPPPARADAAWAVNAPFRNLTSPTYKMYEGDRPPATRRHLRLPGRLFVSAGGGSNYFRDASDPLMMTITPEAAEAIFAESGRTLDELRRRIDSTGRPASFSLAGAQLRIRNAVKTEIVNGKNIIGVIPGSDPVLKDEIIVVGAHLDHIGAFNNVIFNGADDNASGAAAVLELARAFSAESVPPKRTIVFGLWCGEEEGFLGARFFVSRPYAPLAHVVAMVNLDMVGRLSAPGASPVRKLAVHTSCQTPLIKQIVERSCRRVGLDADFFEEKAESLKRSGSRTAGSDHAAFAERDIGFIYMETGIHEDWHSFVDHADKINYAGMEAITRAAFLSIRDIARLDIRPAFDKSIQPPKQTGGYGLVRFEEPGSNPDEPREVAGGEANEPAALPVKKDAGSGSNTTVAPPVVHANANAVQAERQRADTRRTFRLTFDLVGKTDDSRFAGTITVSSAGRILLSTDTIMLRGFRADRIYSRDFDVEAVDLAGAGLRWEIGGTLVDSTMEEVLTITSAAARPLAEPFEGIGFHVSTAGGKLDVRPVVF